MIKADLKKCHHSCNLVVAFLFYSSRRNFIIIIIKRGYLSISFQATMRFFGFLSVHYLVVEDHINCKDNNRIISNDWNRDSFIQFLNTLVTGAEALKCRRGLNYCVLSTWRSSYRPTLWASWQNAFVLRFSMPMKRSKTGIIIVSHPCLKN